MKKVFLYQLLWLLLFPVYSGAQDNNSHEWVILDSTLYQSEEVIPPYPYQSQYDSLEKIQQEVIDSAKAEMERNPGTIIDFFPPVPELYVKLEGGKELDAKAYGEMIKPEIPDELMCMVEYTVEWNGTISQINLNRCRPHLKYDLDLQKFLLNFRARPVKVDSIVLPGRKKLMWLLRGK